MMRVVGRGHEVGGKDAGGAVRGAGRRTSWLLAIILFCRLVCRSNQADDRRIPVIE